MTTVIPQEAGMRTRDILWASTALCAVALIACDDKQGEPEFPEGQFNYGAGASYGQGASGAYDPGGAGAAYGQGAAGQGTTTTTTAAPAAANATPVPPAAAALASPLLRELARKELQGATEDGSAFAGQFMQGQILEQPLQLQPGRCYSVVGIGIGITELDIELVIHQPPAPEFVAAQDNTTGPQAVLGGGQNCFRNPLPIGGPGKVRLRASGGNGLVLAQVYVR
jgi:hypothetical protein